MLCFTTTTKQRKAAGTLLTLLLLLQERSEDYCTTGTPGTPDRRLTQALDQPTKVQDLFK
jgi:hypothetical protein